MKKTNLLLLAVLFSTVLFAQQTTEQQTKDTRLSKEDETRLLSMIGGLSAAHVLNVQEIINHIASVHSNKLENNDWINQKLNMQKNIIQVLIKQVDDVSDAKILNPETDQVFVNDFKVILGKLTDELNLYLAYVKNNNADSKKDFDTTRKETEKSIRVFLRMDDN